MDELRKVLDRALLDEADRDEAVELIVMINANLDKVVAHGKRANSIVKNMLLHSRAGSSERTSVSINTMVEEALNLAYHGARAEKSGFNVTIEKSLDPQAGAADLYAQEMTRVLLNLISNGFYATTKRKETEGNGDYQPTIFASTRDLGGRVEIAIRDNGTGIPDAVKAKMFNPFFTTKPTGEGTGLGLSLSHDIVVRAARRDDRSGERTRRLYAFHRHPSPYGGFRMSVLILVADDDEPGVEKLLRRYGDGPRGLQSALQPSSPAFSSTTPWLKSAWLGPSAPLAARGSPLRFELKHPSLLWERQHLALSSCTVTYRQGQQRVRTGPVPRAVSDRPHFSPCRGFDRLLAILQGGDGGLFIRLPIG